MDDNPEIEGRETTLFTELDAFSWILFNPLFSISLCNATRFISTCLLTSSRMFSKFPVSMLSEPGGKSELLISSANFRAKTLLSSEYEITEQPSVKGGSKLNKRSFNETVELLSENTTPIGF